MGAGVIAAVKFGAEYTINRFSEADGFNGALSLTHPITGNKLTYVSKNKQEFTVAAKTHAKIDRIFHDIGTELRDNETVLANSVVKNIVNIINTTGLNPNAKDVLASYADGGLTRLLATYPETFIFKSETIMPTNNPLDEGKNPGSSDVANYIKFAGQAISNRMPSAADLPFFAEAAENLARNAKSTASLNFSIDKLAKRANEQFKPQPQKTNPAILAIAAAAAGFYFLG